MTCNAPWQHTAAVTTGEDAAAQEQMGEGRAVAEVGRVRAADPGCAIWSNGKRWRQLLLDTVHVCSHVVYDSARFVFTSFALLFALFPFARFCV